MTTEEKQFHDAEVELSLQLAFGLFVHRMAMAEDFIRDYGFGHGGIDITDVLNVYDRIVALETRLGEKP